MIRCAVVVLASLLLSACSTIVDGSHEDIKFKTTPSGASVTVDNRITQKTPCTFELERDEEHVAVIEMPGYKTVTVPIESNLGGTVFGNLIMGGLIGGIIDGASGAAFNLSPDDLDIVLEPGVGQVEWKPAEDEKPDGKAPAKGTTPEA